MPRLETRSPTSTDSSNVSKSPSHPPLSLILQPPVSSRIRIHHLSPGVGGAPRTGGEAGNDQFGNEDLSGASGTSGSGHAPRGLTSAEQEQLGDALLLIVARAALGVGAPTALLRALGPAARPFIAALRAAAIAKGAYSVSQITSEKDPEFVGKATRTPSLE